MIKNHKEDFFKTDDVYRITIRRSHVFEDSLRVFRESDHWEEKSIKIVFSGEPAIDYGGPTREYFRILLKSIANNASILDGPENRRVLRHNTRAFQVSTYFVAMIVYICLKFGGCYIYIHSD